MPAMPTITPTQVSTRGASPEEEEVHRLQVLLNEHQKKGIELSEKLNAAIQAAAQPPIKQP